MLAVAPYADLTDVGLISAAKERALVLRQKTASKTYDEYRIVRQGEYALALLLKAYQGLIVRLVASCQARHNLHYSDLEAEATLAFIEAVNSFEPEKGSLSTWAYIQIRGRLQKIAIALNHEAVAVTKARHSDLVESEPDLGEKQCLLTRIHSLLDQLTNKQQQVIFWVLKDLEWSKIALLLESTSDAVRMLWNRAVQKLRRLIFGEKQPEKQQIELIEFQQHTDVASELKQAESLEPQSTKDTSLVDKQVDIPLVQQLAQGLVKSDSVARSPQKTHEQHSVSSGISKDIFDQRKKEKEEKRKKTPLRLNRFSYFVQTVVQPYCQKRAQTNYWLNFCHSKGVRGSPHLSLLEA